MTVFFSIIIPTYNRPERLTNCLDSLKNLNYQGHNFEIIVVDDGSKDPLDSLVNDYRHSLNLTLIRQVNAGPATARNTGANSARGQYLAFTDDDCRVAQNWLSALEKGFSQTPNALLGGRTINALSDNPYSAASQLLIDYLYDYYNADSAQFFTSNNFAVAKDLFQKVGQFATTFTLAAGEDREFCDRWKHFGYPLRYQKDAIVYHSHHLTLKTFYRQHFNYGRGAFYFHQNRAQRNQQEVKIEPLSFYFKLLQYPFIKVNDTSQISVAFLFLLSQIANASGFFVEKYRTSNH